MSSIHELKEDLGFVAGAVRRSDDRLPASIFVLWAILVPIGFALADFAGPWCGLYWLIVGPAGGIASWLMGRAAEKRAGQRDAALGRRYAHHWMFMGLACLLVGVSAGTGRIDLWSSIPMFMLVSALAYCLAGVHLHRSFLPSGLIMFAGYMALMWLPVSYIWTTTGLIVSGALLAGAFRARAAA